MADRLEILHRRKTERGFDLVEFSDLYGQVCSLQKSSLVTEDAIWLGLKDADPKILASKVKEGDTGWVGYPIHPDVLLSTRMHLNQSQARDLISMLQRFVDTGNI